MDAENIIEAINNAWVANINSSAEFWFWLAGIIAGLFAIALILGGLRFFLTTIFKK